MLLLVITVFRSLICQFVVSNICPSAYSFVLWIAFINVDDVLYMEFYILSSMSNTSVLT